MPRQEVTYIESNNVSKPVTTETVAYTEPSGVNNYVNADKAGRYRDPSGFDSHVTTEKSRRAKNC